MLDKKWKKKYKEFPIASTTKWAKAILNKVEIPTA